jgi:hypothetical protein
MRKAHGWGSQDVSVQRIVSHRNRVPHLRDSFIVAKVGSQDVAV